MNDEPGKKKAAAGWYAHPTMAHTRRYWDGETWTSHISPAQAEPKKMKKPESPAGLIVVGFLGGLVGAGVWAFGSVEAHFWVAFGGSVVISLSTIVTLIGIIGAGVRFGMQHADYERQQRATQ